MESTSRLTFCLAAAVTALAVTTVVLALRLSPAAGEARAPEPPSRTALPAGVAEPAELARLRSSIEAQSIQIAQLRELLQGGTAESAPAVVNPVAPDLSGLSQRLAQTERSLEEILRILRPLELLMAAERERRGSSGGPAGPTPNPSDPRVQRRNVATTVKNDLRLIDAAIDQYAIEFNVSSGMLTFAQLKRYLKPESRLALTGTDPLGSMYGPTFSVGQPPRVPQGTKGALHDVADDAFWSPFQ